MRKGPGAAGALALGEVRAGGEALQGFPAHPEHTGEKQPSVTWAQHTPNNGVPNPSLLFPAATLNKQLSTYF